MLSSPNKIDNIGKIIPTLKLSKSIAINDKNKIKNKNFFWSFDRIEKALSNENIKFIYGIELLLR